ncbi:MAG: hypothetical protein R6X05_09000 [Desulfobacterales bacterium]
MADPESFKLGSNDEDTGSFFEEERHDRRLEKLNQRLTIFSILVPLVIGAIVAYAYVDIKMEFAAVQNKDVQKLSQDLDSRFSSLSLQSAKLEETLKQQLGELQKADSALADKHAELSKQLVALSATVPETTQLQQALTDITSQLSPLAAQLAAYDGALDTLARSNRESLEALTAADQRLETLESGIAKVSQGLAAQPDRRELASSVETALDTERKRFQNRLAEMADLYGAKIQALQQRTDQLERAVTSLANPAAGKTGKPPESSLIFEHDLQ